MGIGGWTVLTMAGMLAKSMSGEIGADWTRNLSLHLASGGGSSFMAWRSTAPRLVLGDAIMLATRYLRTRNLHFIANFDAARVGADAVPVKLISRPRET